MAFTRLVDSWHRDRRVRTRMPWGRRVASMEAQLGADMTPGRHARWERLDHVHDQPEHDTEHQVGDATEEVDHQQRDQRQPGTEQPGTEQPQTEPDSEPELEDDEVEP